MIRKRAQDHRDKLSSAMPRRAQDHRCKICSAMPRRAQDHRCKICSAMPRRAQEEMVGFVLIMVIVAILLVIFIGFSLRTSQKSEVESYEVESFIRSTLQYTTDCKDNLGYLTVTKLIEGCISSEKCLDDRDMCLVLTRDINELVGVSWRIQNRPIVGYEFNILSEKEDIIPAIVQGNSTNNYKAGFETFSRGGSPISVRLKVYY